MYKPIHAGGQTQLAERAFYLFVCRLVAPHGVSILSDVQSPGSELF